MASLPGLRPVAAVTLQVGGVSVRAGLVCEAEGFCREAVETQKSHDLAPELRPPEPRPRPLSPSHAHMIAASQEFMQTGDKEDEDLFLYDMFDISAQGEELQGEELQGEEPHTCQVSLFEEHCSLCKEETDQSAHLRTNSDRTPPEAKEESKTRSKTRSNRRSNRRSRVRPRASETSCDPPRTQSPADGPGQDCRTEKSSREDPGGGPEVGGPGGPGRAGPAGRERPGGPRRGGPGPAGGAERVCGTKRKKKLQKLLQKQTNFSCSECHRSFSSALTLRRHAGVHSDLRPFSCSFCSFTSRLRASVEQHQRTHTGEDLSGVPFARTLPSIAVLCSDTRETPQ
ncbi:hypothetical protein WMY93_031642 [Mugilogobius chulae]|uniref:C2H2-type domain-containing protein n=1 Tax=Mugilogobius chulae TaxID=88201 RepID=A0AAW0MF65_9GOBI